jgi:hypothetical protein
MWLNVLVKHQTSFIYYNFNVDGRYGTMQVMAAIEFQRIKKKYRYLTQPDVIALTYENFINLPQKTINNLVQKVTDLNDQGILNGLWMNRSNLFYLFIFDF